MSIKLHVTKPSVIFTPTAAVALGIAIATHSIGANAFPTVFGKINASLNNYSFEKNNFAESKDSAGAVIKDAAGNTVYTVKGGTTTDSLDNWALESNSSRIGVSGDLSISEGLKAIYRLEYGTKVDNGSNNGQVFSQRNIWGGLEGDFGRVIAGKNDTPLKLIQTNSVLKTDIDRFNDLPLADIGTYLAGENRADNIVQYSSPILLEGLELSLAAVQGEETGIADPKATAPAQNDNGIGSGYSVSAIYGKANWYLGAALDNNVATSDTARLLGEVKFGPLTLGAIYQDAQRHEDVDVLGGYSSFVGASVSAKGVASSANPLLDWDGSTKTTPQYQKQTGYVLNGTWDFPGPWQLKAQYGSSTSTPIAAYSDVELASASLGVDYKFNESTRLYAYTSRLTASGDDKINTATNTNQTFATGIDIKF